MNPQSKAREFKLFKARSYHKGGGRDHWTVRNIDNDKPHANPHLVTEKYHVIEKSAYDKAVEALKEIAKDTCEANPWTVVDTMSARKAKETLRELGE